MEQCDERATRRARCMNLEAIRSVGDVAVRVPAVPA
jgi:hypothetical protein